MGVGGRPAVRGSDASAMLKGKGASELVLEGEGEHLGLKLQVKALRQG